MALASGTRFGTYEITGALGAGGMGEVYRARDTALDRDVAIKILPPWLAADTERIARFEREAKTLAALNHGNIAHIYGLERSGPTTALVMELVEGMTLAERIAAGPVPATEALDMAKQIAAALEAAHTQGIVHRDLKPANVKLGSDGIAKVLDFGIAKVLDARATSGPKAVTTPAMTEAGMVLGTAAYMSPEQARGKAVDQRADIWAFGCVLYELLTGQPAFGGESVTDTLARVLERDADLRVLPKDASPAVRRTLELCFEKDPRARIADIRDVRLALDGRFETAPGAATRQARAPFGWLAAGIAVVGIVTAAALAPSALTHWRETSAEAAPMRFDLLVPILFENNARIEISPDGRHVAFRSQFAGNVQLWLRSLDASAPRPLPETDGVASDFFWSPDSSEIAFTANGTLRAVSLTGSTRIIARLPSDWPGGSSGGGWSNTGVILLGPPFAAQGSMMQVAASGGTLTPVLPEIDDASLPSFLADGRQFVFAKVGAETPLAESGMYLGSLDTPGVHKLADDAVEARAGGDSLLFVRNGALIAQSLDVASSALTGAPSVLANDVSTSSVTRRSAFSVSATGTLVYVTNQARQSQLTWMTRAGAPAGTVGEPAQYRTLALSRDGLRIAFGRVESDGTSNLWTHDLVRDIETRLTVGSNTDTDARWSPDSTRLIYGSSRPGQGKLVYERSASGGPERPIAVPATPPISIDDWSADGRHLLYRSPGNELWVLPLAGETPPVPIVRLQTSGFVDQSSFAPSSEWVAYNSNESGRTEVYLTQFPPSASGERLQVSGSGGVQPLWNSNGRELFFLSPDGALMAVDFAPDQSPPVGTPRELFRSAVPPLDQVETYAVAPDGNRFLMMLPTGGDGTAVAQAIVNWPALLREAAAE